MVTAVMLSVVMLSLIMLTAVMLSVIVLKVRAPFSSQKFRATIFLATKMLFPCGGKVFIERILKSLIISFVMVCITADA